MTESTPEDWGIVVKHAVPYNKALPDRVLTHLHLLRDDFGGYAVDRLEHCLQTATRAHRDGRDEEYVVCALLHDIGDTLGSFNHPDIAAAIVKPFVDDSYHWMVQQHGIFQGYYFFEYLGLDRNLREQFAGHPHYTSAPSSARSTTSPPSIPTTRRWRSRSSNRCCGSSSPGRSARSTCATTPATARSRFSRRRSSRATPAGSSSSLRSTWSSLPRLSSS